MATRLEDLEVAKENSRPLVRGRDPAAMAEAISASPQQLQETAQEYERAIEEYEGDDPLQPWLEYIRWALQAYPTGKNLLALLEQCCMTFKDSQLYRDNKRYLKTWISFAHNLPEPEDIFEYLREQEIGQSHALFYQAWARCHENRGQFDTAAAIIEEGFRKGARPTVNLQLSAEQLERLRKQHPAPSNTLSASNRHTLGELKGSRDPRSHRNCRSARPLSLQQQQPANASASSNFHVFSDDAPPTVPSLPSTGSGRTFPFRRQMNKENAREATTWNKPLRNRISSRKQSPPPASFEVYEEESADVVPGHLGSRSSKPLRKRLDGAVNDQERLNGNPLLNVHRLAPIEVRKYDLDAMFDDEMDDPEGLSFEELRACSIADQEDEEDAMCMTVNHSQILKRLTPSDSNMFSPRARAPLRPRPPDTPLQERESENGGVDSIETFLESSQDNIAILPRSSLPPPSPTVTMTVNTRAALDDVNAMLQSGDTTPLSKPTSAPASAEFEIFDDSTAEPPAPPPSKQIPLTLSPVSSRPNIIDPFSQSERERALEDASREPQFWSLVVDHRSVAAPDEVREIEEDFTLELDHVDLLVMNRIADHVYEAENLSVADGEHSELAVKKVTPASMWEPLIAFRLCQRIQSEALITASSSYHFNDCSLVLSPRTDDLGTLQTLILAHQAQNTAVPELVAMLYTKEVLSIVESLHANGILHCSLKPSHFVLRNEMANLALIDFSSAIDLKQHPSDAKFVSESTPYAVASCPVIRDGRPWRFEIDTFGVASVVHQLLFGAPIEVVSVDGSFCIKSSIPDSYAEEVWNALFQTLLNAHDSASFYSEALRHLIDMHLEETQADEALRLQIVEQNVLLSQ